MNRYVGLAVVIAALAAAGTGYAVTIPDENQSSFTFNITNGKITDINSARSETGSAITGSQNVPNVGTCNLTGRLFITGGTNHGTFTITVKKTGDKIFFTFAGKTENSESELEGTVKITGGTGKFENAFGAGSFEAALGKAVGKTDGRFFTLITQGSIVF